MRFTIASLLFAAVVASAAAIIDAVAEWEYKFLEQQQWLHDNSSVKLLGFKR